MFKKVLVAEDYDHINLGLKSVLEDMAVGEVTSVTYCDEALLKIKEAHQSEEPFDLLITDLSFDPDKATFEDPTPSVLDGQWHDAATKLDLAKAYQEMGDVEGAREILQEVLHEGDEQQRTEAQAILTKLG